MTPIVRGTGSSGRRPLPPAKCRSQVASYSPITSNLWACWLTSLGGPYSLVSHWATLYASTRSAGCCRTAAKLVDRESGPKNRPPRLQSRRSVRPGAQWWTRMSGWVVTLPVCRAIIVCLLNNQGDCLLAKLASILYDDYTRFMWGYLTHMQCMRGAFKYSIPF